MTQKMLLAKFAIAGLLVLAVGCAKTAPTSNPSLQDRSAQQEVSAWRSIDEGNFRQSVSKLGALPNIGLQLPVASPDGRWVAALSAQNVEAIDPDAAFSGRTLDQISLVLFDTEHTSKSPRVIAAGAAWPVWSHDSQTLYSVSYDKSGHCGILMTDVATGKNRKLGVRIDHIISPSLSPSGNSLAFAAFAQLPQQARLYVYRLDQQQLYSLAAPKEMVWQIMPLWIDEHALIYYGRVGAKTALFGTSANGTDPNVRLADLKLPPLAADALLAQAGLVSPYRSDANCLATFETDHQRILLTHLDDLKSSPLDAASQAGIWSEDPLQSRFVYGTDKKLCLQTIRGETRLLVSQPLIPLWYSPGGSNMLALAPGQNFWAFDLLRLKFEPAS